MLALAVGKAINWSQEPISLAGNGAVSFRFARLVGEEFELRGEGSDAIAANSG
ncbi:MAG: hypothetical protein NHB32_25345 [Fischerella sp. CENA71]|nr:hypothetical protein [Fischerella sp. CENA71]